ncbi:MAG: hypothetical protein V7K25_14935 [Nostoc sp.]|uniref:hypothetical protein n=1 Tax=Nostoc sp. TaxID=1180 RepID=UPI002FFAC5AC
MSFSFAKGRWTWLPLWEMLLPLSMPRIEVASSTLPANPWVRATCFQVRQAIDI